MNGLQFWLMLFVPAAVCMAVLWLPDRGAVEEPAPVEDFDDIHMEWPS